MGNFRREPMAGRKARAVPVVKVIARHRGECTYKGNDNAIACGCPKMFRYFQDGTLKREAAPTDWQAALAHAKQMETDFALVYGNGNGQANGNGNPMDIPATPVVPVV